MPEMRALPAPPALASLVILATLPGQASRLLAGVAEIVARKLCATPARPDPAAEGERPVGTPAAGRPQPLGRDLHDDLGPFLASATMRVDAVRSVLTRDPVEAERLICDLREDLREALAELRRLASRPELPSLGPLDLPTAIGLQAARFERACGGRLEIRFTWGFGRPGRLPGRVEVELYRIASEALTNVVRHSSARGCTVSLRVDDTACLEVLDDGVGLPADLREGTGLSSMRERARALGGECEVTSEHTGGTLVRTSIPLAGLR